jgi:hypothetical protein
VIVTAKTLAEGQRLPWGYAVAYWRPYSHTAVCYPVGLHWLISVSRRVYYWLIHTRVVEPWEEWGPVQYEKGRQRGREEGMIEAIRLMRLEP